MATGITKRHSKGCRSRAEGRCNCDGGLAGGGVLKRDGRRSASTSRPRPRPSPGGRTRHQLDPGHAARPDQDHAPGDGRGVAAGAESGEVRNRSGHPYKPSTLRGYRQALRSGCCRESAARS